MANYEFQVGDLVRGLKHKRAYGYTNHLMVAEVVGVSEYTIDVVVKSVDPGHPKYGETIDPRVYNVYPEYFKLEKRLTEEDILERKLKKFAYHMKRVEGRHLLKKVSV